MSPILPILFAASLLSPLVAPLSANTVQGDGGLRLYGQDGIKDSYVVVFKPMESDAVDAQVTRLVQSHEAKADFTYRNVLQGFSATMSEATALKLTQDDAVAYVEQDQQFAFTGEQTDAPWGIASLDSRTGFDRVYRFGTHGNGVHAYVIDSGIRATHTDFGGRATADAEFAGDGRGPEDCHGHGTSMAGIVGGDVHGVAKLVRIHGLRIGCTAGSTRAFMAAADWLAVNAARPAVANLAFQARPSEAMDTAAMSLITRNIAVVASAGNGNMDACNFSPSRVPAVITVAAIHALRERLPSSSWGPCVDIFAPGDQIDTTGHASDTETILTGGTSPAAAHVTGAAARYLERFPTAPPALVEATLLSEATRDRVIDARSPNNLLYLDVHGPGNDGYGRTGGDVNGDGRDDIVTFVRGEPADVWVALSDGVRFGTSAKWHEYFAAGNEVPMLGDVNGDGRDDLITFTRGSAADVYVALSTGTSFGASTRWHDWFAAFSETPLVGDFNGDGRADIATLTRSDSADVYVATSNGTSFVGTGVKWAETFAPGAPAVLAGDVTCDGRDDLIAFDRASVGRVTVAVSLGSSFATPRIWRSGLVTGTQVPVVGDFTGDGCDDVAVFERGSGGRVSVAASAVGRWGLHTFEPNALWGIGFATGVGVPGAGDFTGDGLMDFVNFTRGQAADVYVGPSTGSAVGPVRRWHDWFAFGLEVPMPASLW